MTPKNPNPTLGYFPLSSSFEASAPDIVRVLDGFDLAGRAAALATPGFIYMLADGGKADDVVRMLDALEPDQRAAALAVPDAIWSLADNDKIDDVVHMLDALEPAQRAAALAAPDAVWGLAENGKADDAVRMLDALAPAHRATALTADSIRGLVSYGKTDDVERWKKELTATGFMDKPKAAQPRTPAL